MANFDNAIDIILKHEGGYVNNINDPGGATNFGITLRVLKGLGSLGDIDGDGDIDEKDIQILPLHTAKEIYKRLYWNCEDIESQAVAGKVFDMNVNLGLAASGLILQRACNDLGYGLSTDGKIGTKTISAVNSIPDTKLMSALCADQAAYYWNLIYTDVRDKAKSYGWPLSHRERGIKAAAQMNVPECKKIVSELKSVGIKTGKMTFADGWIKRAAERFGI